MSVVVNAASSTPLRDLHGRGMNPKTDDYNLPADLEEFNRLDLQHRIWVKVMDGHVPFSYEELDHLLQEKDGRRPAIFDLGRGSGIWSIEMAERYPQARVVGFDLVDSQPTTVSTLPQNCTFFTGNVLDGLDTFYNQFDLVHLRMVVVHMRGDAAKREALKQAVGCLRPGGVLVISDLDESFVDENKEILRPTLDHPAADNSHRSWSSRIFNEVDRRTNDGEVVMGKYIESCPLAGMAAILSTDPNSAEWLM